MTSSNFIDDLEPAMVWRHFAALSQRPRPSGKEELARKYVTEWAGRHGLQWERDAVGNVVVRAPGRGRGIDAPGVILQGHLDIVCEKNSDVVHDFELDPIRLRRAGDRVFAQGTTLGADNGVGVALALAAAEGLYQHHPPLELLLTVDEESGLSGAMELNGSMLKYRQMINLDAEEEGTLYVGCAGGEDRSVSAPVRRQPLSGVDVGMVISVRGLRGGHSGIDIIHNRGNAIRLLVLALNRLRTMDVPYSLVALNGGSKRNAIPREADAIVRVPVGVGERVVKSVGQIRAELGLLHGESEPGLELSVQPADDNRGALAPELEDGLLKFLFTVPNGVLAMSPSISGLVETSSNLGVMVTGEERIEISLCSRSSRGPALGLVGE
ncbi:MAG: aminoacyl-histidine dipeptidase, partial [Gammaproteobacteria bacterium]|nr:aminoacyl-histidine dipeptidase [Gammaproteobacteria bacterium]